MHTYIHTYMHIFIYVNIISYPTKTEPFHCKIFNSNYIKPKKTTKIVQESHMVPNSWLKCKLWGKVAQKSVHLSAHRQKRSHVIILYHLHSNKKYTMRTNCNRFTCQGYTNPVQYKKSACTHIYNVNACTIFYFKISTTTHFCPRSNFIICPQMVESQIVFFPSSFTSGKIILTHGRDHEKAGDMRW